MRVEIHVRPNASETSVGGEYNGALVVRVVEAAEGGRATDAALRAIARALDLPGGSVELVRGATSRRKLIQITMRSNAAPAVDAALQRLRSI
jgi:uncharacterized protein YggU (UPF0235/DUF167 family)